MTIVASPERRSRKQKPLVSETSPLLPEKHQDGEDGVHEGFNGASFSGAVFNLSTTVVGAGIMALPATMKVLGLILGSLLIIFVCFLTDASIDILLRFSRAGAAASYGGVMGDAFGKIGKMLLQICVIINNLGILIVYMIIIGDVLSGTSSNGVHHAGILEEWFGFHWWNGRVPILVLTIVLILAPLVSFKGVAKSALLILISTDFQIYHISFGPFHSYQGFKYLETVVII